MDFDFLLESITPTQAPNLLITATGALGLPSGTTGQQPSSPSNGWLRHNSSNNNLEFWNGSSWLALSSAGGSVSSITVTTTTGLTVSTSNTQTITNSGTFALELDVELQGLSGLSANGFPTRTGSGTFASRTITGTSGRITLSNGDGVSGNPTIDLDTVGSAVTAQFVKITTDAYGRTTATTAVTTSDITALVDATYVNVSGDSMSSAANLTFSGGGEVLGLPAVPSGPTAAASAAYVDSMAQGLDPKGSVRVATTAAGTLASSFENGDTVDGVTLATGNRILIKNQAAPAENGIYVVAASGAPTRATDMDAWAEVPGAYVFVEEGTANADTGWVCTSNSGGTLNTTAITFAQFAGAGSYTAGTGLTLTGTQFSITSPIATTIGGTGLTSIGTSNQVLGVNNAAGGLEYKTVTAGTAMGVVHGAGTITINNAGVTSNVAGTGISVSGATGAVTITNDGVTSAVAGTGIGVSGATGAVTITNNGVTGITGTANQITASASTGSVTLSTPSTFIAPGSVAVTTSLFASYAGSISAAGSNQGTATALTADVNTVSTVAASTGVVLPAAASPFGRMITVYNRGANALAVYPASGGSIDGGAANAAVSVPAGASLTVISATTTQWYSAVPVTTTTGSGISATYGNGVLTLANTGVTSIVAGTAIGISGGTGAVTVNNTGVTALTGTANQITVSASTGSVTLSLPSAVTIGTSLTVSGLTANSFLYSGTAGLLTTTAAPTNGQVLIGSTGTAPVAATLTQGTGISITNGAGSITIANTGVTSVGLSITGPLYTISNSPVTTTGTLTATLNTQTANTMFAGPTSGGAAAPTFRTLVIADIRQAIKLYDENPSSPTAPTVGGTNAVAIGSGSSASAIGAVAIGAGTDSRTWGGKAIANGSFASAGDAQHGIYVARNSTTNATPTELYLDGAGASQRFVMPNNSVFVFSIFVAGRRTDATGGSAGYKFEGVIKRDGSAATTAVVGSVSKTVLAETNTAWDASITADTTNGSLTITVTGEAAKTIRWVATIQTTEVTN